MKAIGAVASMALAVTGCKLGGNTVQSGSTTKTVGIPLSKVKNQGMSGFCWSYSINGMVESWALSHKSLQLTLSEDYTAFFRLAKQIHAFTMETDGDTLAAGGYACPLKQGAHLKDVIELVREYGVVPSNVWNSKIPWNSAGIVDELKQKLLEKLGQYVKGRKAGTTTLQEIVDHVMVGEGLFPPLPKGSFSYGGQNWTPQSFLRERIGFNPDDYVDLMLTKPEDYETLVGAIKRSLAQGIPVPIGMHLLRGRSAEIKPFEANHIEPKVSNFTSQGGHIVLATDFVNAGGQIGAMSKGEIEKAVAESPENVAFVVVKNSWGEEQGSATPGVPRGFMVVDKGYLKGTLAYGYANILVPRAIAANPTGAPVTVAPYVAAGGNDFQQSLYAKEIQTARSLGLMSGMPDGSFRPAAPVPRGQLAMVVVAALRGLPGNTVKLAQPASTAFADVPASHYAAPAIAWASGVGLVSGISANEFQPEKPVSRAAVVAVLNKAAEVAWRWKRGGAAFPVSGSSTAFRDSEGHWAAAAIDRMSAFCATASAYKGEAGIFAPDEMATRDALAAAIVRWFDCIKK
jgi:hypothetical protein